MQIHVDLSLNLIEKFFGQFQWTRLIWKNPSIFPFNWFCELCLSVSSSNPRPFIRHKIYWIVDCIVRELESLEHFTNFGLRLILRFCQLKCGCWFFGEALRITGHFMPHQTNERKKYLLKFPLLFFPLDLTVFQSKDYDGDERSIRLKCYFHWHLLFLFTWICPLTN